MRIRRARFRVFWASVTFIGILLACGLTAGQAARGAPSPRPAQSGFSPGRGFLGAVSCVGSSFCIGVGPDIDGLLDSTPYSQVWNGTKVSRMLAVPARNPLLTGLFGISCTSTKNCVAVGGENFEDGGQVSDAWNGSSWTMLPVPKGGYSDALNGVACTGARTCIAVGSGPNFAMAQTWNGTSWRLTPHPVIPHRTLFSEFNGIACNGPSRCLAVGDYATQTSKGLLALAESWNGHSWKMLPALPAAASWNGVACPSVRVCVAVGDGHGLGSDVVSARWNGRSWTVLTTPGLGGKKSDQTLSSVSCPSVSYCIAAGSGPGISGGLLGAGAFAEKWTGGSAWTLLSVPDPPAFDSDGRMTAPTSLAGVSCASRTRCLAVGGDEDTDAISSYTSFAVSWNGTSWRALRTGKVDLLMGVACAPHAYCLTTGTYLARNDWTRTLTEIWNGSSMRLASPPGLAGVLSLISCPSASFCMAARGASTAIWNGKRWSSSGVGDTIYPNYLSCVSREFCMTIGFGKDAPISEFWNGHTWHSARIVTPKGDFPDSFPSGLSCATPRTCLAVGSLQAGNGDPIGTFAEAWNGSTWRVLRSPFQHQPSDTLSAVDCRTATDCLTIGGDHGSNGTTLFTARWNGRNWKVTKLPGSQRRIVWGDGPGPSSLSCPTATNCVAVGGDSRNTDYTLIWNGHSWRVMKAGGPAGIFDVSCASAHECVATGQPGTTTLAKLWNGRTWKLIKTINP
jgi:hypothetical protein